MSRWHRFCSSDPTPSRNEFPVSLSLGFRQQLAALVQAHDEGCGPVEREAVRQLTTGLPMTAVQIRSFAEDCYPIEIREFLESRGYQALYHRDLDRALAIGTENAGSPTIRGGAATAEPRRRDRRKRWLGIGLGLVVLLAASLAGGLILMTAMSKLQRESLGPERPSATVVPPPSVRSSPPSPCVQSMRDSATTWCENALTGRVVGDPAPKPGLAGCGDRLRVNGDAVRLALDRLFEEQATYTYSYDQVRERCVAAAKLAAP